MTHLQAFAKARSLFKEGQDREAVLDFLHQQDIPAAEAERLANEAHRSVKEDQEDTAGDRAFGGPWGKIGIGLLAVGVFAYGVVQLDRMLNIVLLIGLIFLGDGVWRLVKGSDKKGK